MKKKQFKISNEKLTIQKTIKRKPNNSNENKQFKNTSRPHHNIHSRRLEKNWNTKSHSRQFFHDCLNFGHNSNVSQHFTVHKLKTFTVSWKLFCRFVTALHQQTDLNFWSNNNQNKLTPKIQPYQCEKNNLNENDGGQERNGAKFKWNRTCWIYY